MNASERYPKAVRIRRRRDFLAIQRKGRRRHMAHFVVVRMPAIGPGSRLGVTVSRRVGNAVARNRVKRLVREIFRRRRSAIPEPSDLVVIAKPGADELTYGAVASELERALDLASIR